LFLLLLLRRTSRGCPNFATCVVYTVIVSFVFRTPCITWMSRFSRVCGVHVARFLSRVIGLLFVAIDLLSTRCWSDSLFDQSCSLLRNKAAKTKFPCPRSPCGLDRLNPQLSPHTCDHSAWQFLLRIPLNISLSDISLIHISLKN